MKGSELYPGIVYFKLAKEMPLSPVGSTVSIFDTADRKYLYINGIEMPVDTAIKQPEWFIAVGLEEHQRNCKNSSIEYFMDKGLSRKDAERLWEEWF